MPGSARRASHEACAHHTWSHLVTRAVTRCDAVQVVKMVIRERSAITLGIGDGANDVSMIQARAVYLPQAEAHLGMHTCTSSDAPVIQARAVT